MHTYPRTKADDYDEYEYEFAPESDFAIAERNINLIQSTAPEKTLAMKAVSVVLGAFSLYFDYLNTLALGLMYRNMEGDSVLLAYGKAIGMSFIIEVTVFFLGCIYNNNPNNKHKYLLPVLFVCALAMLGYTSNALYGYYSWQADPDSAIYNAENKERLAQNYREVEAQVRTAEEVVISAQKRLSKLNNDLANFESLHRNDGFEEKERARQGLSMEIQRATQDLASARTDVTSIRASGEAGAKSFMDQDRSFRKQQKEAANKHPGFANDFFGSIGWQVFLFSVANFASSFLAGWITVIGKEVTEKVIAMREQLVRRIVD